MENAAVHATNYRKISVVLMLIVFAAISVFSPFLITSVEWACRRTIPYEGRATIVLPFRWTPTEGAGLVLEKSKPTLNFEQGSVLGVMDQGVHVSTDHDALPRMLRAYGISESTGIDDPRTHTFASAKLICGRVGTTSRSKLIAFYCYSPDLRYRFDFTGRTEDVESASRIAQQIESARR